ncbi:hypothetical protein QAD02_012908 [Eretmocerus hayati]|uniref:Uncharacterized protein n=1 Tax=Eretmocerus hayati TaxID=131215 RepID=A0ACC2P125_9HYME|nr:hypothetical protein QAD02_012908 [Eretmocerus hayati]
MIGHGAQNENATCEPQESAHLQSRDFQDELGSFPAEKSAERENCFRKRSETKPHPPSDCEMDQIDLHKDMNLEIATRKPHVDQSWNSGEEVDKAQLLSKAMIDEIENSVSDSVNFHSSPGVNTKMFIENPSGVDRNRAVLCKVDIDPKSTSQRLWEVERSKSDDLVGIESTTSCSNSMKKREKPRIIGNVTLREPLIVKTTSTKSHARLVKPLRKSLGRRYSDPKKITSSRSNDHSTQVHGRIVSSVNFNQMSPTNLGIPLNPIVDVESTHSESPLASNTNLEDSRNFDNQNSLNLIASDLDIASLPFVLSEDLLDSKNMEKLSLGCSNEFKKTEGAQEISSHYPEIINPHQFSDEVLGIATVDQRKYETRNTAKNESKGFEPAEIRIKTILSEVPNELRHTHKADPCSIEVSLTDRSTSGKCVIVQTSGRQKRLKTHRAVVLATPKESENAQIVHQGGKVVILSPPKPDQHEKESFHVDLPLEIRTKTLEESIEDGIFHESECSLPKADDDMSSSKEDLCRAVLNSVKSDQQEVRSHRATTLSNEEISAGNDSSSSLSLPEKQLLDDPSIIHRVEHLKCPVESAGRSNMTEANAKCRRIVSKGTILTPITGSQVKLLVAKSMRRTTARKLENESKFGRDTTAPIPFPSFPDSNTPTGVLHPPKMIVHASSSGRESRFQGASSKSYTLTSASSSFSSDEITRACLKSMDSIHCPTSVMPKLGNIQHSSGRELPAKDNKYESKEGSKPKSQSSISATKYLVTPKEPVTESEHPCSSIASRCSTRVDVDSNLRRRATTSSSAGFESDRTELPCKKLLSDIPGGFEVGHLEHKSPPVTDKIHCTDSSEQIEIATLPAESDDSAQSHIFVTVGNQTDAVLRIGDSTISPIDIDDTDDPSHLLRTNISDHCVIPEGASGAAGELSSINQVPVTWESIRAIQKVDSIQSENLSSENRDICPTALVYSNLEHRVQMSDTNTAAATNDQQPESLIKPTFFLSVSGMPTPPNEPIATSFKVTNDALTDCDNSGSMTTSDGTTSHLSSGTSVENQSLHSSTNVVSKIEDSHVSTNPSMCGAIDGSSTRVHQDQDVERIAQTPNPLVQQINPELRASLTKCRVKSIQSIERLTPMAHPTITGIGPKHAETNAESVQTHANRSASQVKCLNSVILH